MKKIRMTTTHSKPYYVGAEILVKKESEKEVDRIQAKLKEFGSKATQAQRWLKSFPPLNTVKGDELKRVVFRLPFGYRERRDIIAQYKERGYTHENARYHMLSDHAGPGNTLVYVTDPESQGSGSNPDKQNVEQPVVEGPPDADGLSRPVVDEDGSSNESDQGSVNFVSEDQETVPAAT